MSIINFWYIRSRVSTALGSDYESVYKDFIAFAEDIASKDDTWMFWYGFVFQDCLAIHGGTWSLRMASLKEMCPLFTPDTSIMNFSSL